MIKFRLAQLGLAMAALGFTAATPVLGLSSAYAAETVRAEIGGPLQAAQSLMKAGKNKEALNELHKLDSVGGKTANEAYLIERVRAAAASGAGDNDAAAKSFEALIASGKLPPGEAAKFSEGLVGIYMRAKEYAKANAAIQRSLKEHDDPKMRAYLIQNYVSMGNIGAATKDLQEQLKNDERAGRASSEDNLQQMANLQNKSGDKSGYVNTIEKLAASYPKPSYWLDLLNRVTAKQGFSERLGVDIYRLKLANNLLKKPSEYLELAQLVLRDGAPGEAVKVVDKGYKAGILGTGSDAARHQRLKDLAEKQLADGNKNLATTEAALDKARDNDGLVNLGYALVQAGQADKGLKMMEAAIKAGDLKRPDDAKLHLGQAYAVAGKKAQAISTLKSVGGKDGTAELARYWIMAINHPMA
ncbi:MAG: tetratricopeptide repeat protein [Pseudomonadota bacterium]